MGLYIKLGLLAIGLTLAAARNPCANWKGRALPDISDCRKYIYCQDHVPYEFECPTTYHFDLHLRKCRPMHLAVCATGMFRRRSIPTAPPKTTCARLPTTTTKPVPTVSTTTPSGQPSSTTSKTTSTTEVVPTIPTIPSTSTSSEPTIPTVSTLSTTFKPTTSTTPVPTLPTISTISTTASVPTIPTIRHHQLQLYIANNFNYKINDSIINNHISTHKINVFNIICAYYTNSFYIINHI
ncbi:chitin binding peritrophin-A domain-containing protein [Phthorimaea operculella]|nr:chitin binding peritrophin-A domain-containing protein [Phthorimaea operculella]